MKTKRKFKYALVLLISMCLLFLAGCASTGADPLATIVEEDKQVIEETDSTLVEEEEEEMNESEVNNSSTGKNLEMINGNPIGDYGTNEITRFMIIKKDPHTDRNMPGGFLKESHPYIAEIGDKLEELFIALYEIDYRTVTPDRYEGILKGELDGDNEYLNIAGILHDQVITEVVDSQVDGVTFQEGMEQARVSSEVIYRVLQSSEQESVWNKYLEGKDFIASTVSEVEIINGEWEVTHVLELVVEVLEEEASF